MFRFESFDRLSNLQSMLNVQELRDDLALALSGDAIDHEEQDDDDDDEEDENEAEGMTVITSP